MSSVIDVVLLLLISSNPSNRSKSFPFFRNSSTIFVFTENPRESSFLWMASVIVSLFFIRLSSIKTGIRSPLRISLEARYLSRIDFPCPAVPSIMMFVFSEISETLSTCMVELDVGINIFEG